MGQQGIPPGNLYFLLSLSQRRAGAPSPPPNGDEPPEPDYLFWFVAGTGLASAIGVAIVLVCA